MNTRQQKITAALHKTRHAPTIENLFELSDAMEGALPEEMAIGLLKYGHDMLSAAKKLQVIRQDPAVSAHQERNDRTVH